jgi:hypothetical protein
MSHRIVFPIVVALSLIAVVALTGCRARALPGAVPTSSPTHTSAILSGAGAEPGKQKCSDPGTTIPAGTYSGDITSTLKTVMNLTLPNGGSISNAGGGSEQMDGVVKIVSNGHTVSGSIALGGLGTSYVGGSYVVHSKTEGDFTGLIFGPADDPTVRGKMGGAWETLDAPVIGGSGSATSFTTVGLHVTAVSCDEVTGDAIAMFSEIAKPVAQYITISGDGTWTAKRK